MAWFFEELSVADMNVSNATLATADAEHQQVLTARRQQMERLRYAAQLAERQFLKSDPENRLVTSELERRWRISDRIRNGTIQAIKDAKANCYLFPDTPATLAALRALIAEHQSHTGCG